MTATQAQLRIAQSARTRVEEPSPPVRAALCVRWEISARALVAAPASVALLNGHASKLERAGLEWRMSLAEGRVTATCVLVLEMRGGETDTLILLDGVQVGTQIEGGYEHLDVPGRLAVTLRSSDRKLVLAVTTVLNGALGLPGGVYEAPTLIGA